MIGIGVDIGGTFVKLYVMNDKGEILQKDKVETNYEHGAENFLKQIADFINKTDVTQFTQTPLFTDTANVTEVILQKKKIPLLENAVLRLYGDRMTVLEDTDAPLIFPFDETSAVTVLGRNKLNVYFNGHVYQFKGGKRFNALKFVHIYHRYKNISKGDADGSFLGL